MPKTHANHAVDFRKQAVDLLLSSGRPLKLVAAELGVSPNSLRNWRDRAVGAIRRLHRENEFLAPPARHPNKSHEHTQRGSAAGYTLIDLMRTDYGINELCPALGLSRSGYYANKRRADGVRAEQNQQLLAQIRCVHADRHLRAYGSPRMTRELHDRGLACSENRVASLMRQAGIRVRPRRAFRPEIAQRDHAACPSPNHLAQAPGAQRPGEQLVSDITYVPTAEGWHTSRSCWICSAEQSWAGIWTYRCMPTAWSPRSPTRFEAATSSPMQSPTRIAAANTPAPSCEPSCPPVGSSA